MARGDSGDDSYKVTRKGQGDKPKGPLRIRLRGGEELEVAGLGISGYVAAPMGAMILGGTASRATVGKFCIGVDYPDGETGIIAQEEIAEIIDAEGNPVAYGNAKYPGHPDFDPRDGFDPIQDQIDTLKKAMKEKDKRQERIKEKGLAAVLEEEMAKYRKMWGERDGEADGLFVEEAEEGKPKGKGKKKGKKKDSDKKSKKKKGAGKKDKKSKKKKSS